MTTSGLTPELPRSAHQSLRGQSLPWYGYGGLAIGSFLISLLLWQTNVFNNWFEWVVVALLLYLIAQTVVSAIGESGRRARDRLATSLITGAFLLALLPLALILGYTIYHGIHRLDSTFFTHSMRLIQSDEAGGGVYHAILGTLEQAGLAALMAVPIGVLTAIYLVEYGRGFLSRAVSFMVDVMTGLPSIVAGLFILSFWVLTLGIEKQGAGFAGSLALALLMIPVVVRGSEEMLKLVPDSLREASYALGVPKWRTILRVVLPTALPGIVTSVMLGVARVMGETAPVLLLVGSTTAINGNPFSGAQESLSYFIYSTQNAPHSPTGPTADRIWSAALTLIALVMILNILARLLTRRVRVRSPR